MTNKNKGGGWLFGPKMRTIFVCIFVFVFIYNPFHLKNKGSIFSQGTVVIDIGK